MLIKIRYYKKILQEVGKLLPKGVVHLSHCPVIDVDCDSNEFRLLTNDDEFYLKAESLKEKEIWMTKLLEKEPQHIEEV